MDYKYTMCVDVCIYLMKCLLVQIIFNSVAYEAGLKNRDYIYEVNGVSVLEMSHDQCTKLIKDAGNSIDIKIERYGVFKRRKESCRRRSW